MKKMNKTHLKDRIIAIVTLILIPIFFEQLLPVGLCMCGIDAGNAVIIGAFTTILLSLYGYRILLKSNNEQIPCRSVKLPGVIILVVLMFIFSLLDQVFSAWITAHMTDPGMEARLDSISNTNLYVYLIYAIFIAPIAEECMFRIYLNKYIQQYFSWMVSIVATSVMFGLIHGTIVHVVTATLFGLLLSLIFEYTQCIWITTVCHMAYNMSITVESGTEMSLLYSSTVMTVLVFLATVFVLCWFMVKKDNEMKGLNNVEV